MHKTKTSVSNVDLIDGTAAKDKSAFNEIYTRFSQLVFNMAYKVVRDREEAEEVVQDVFVQIWKTASTYDKKRAAVSTWIINIARSRSIDKYRSLGYKKSNTEFEEKRMESAVDFSDAVEIKQGKKTVMNAMDDLPEEQRVVVEMAYYYGFTHSEIAEELSEPLGTIKTRIRLGVAKLRDMLLQE